MVVKELAGVTYLLKGELDPSRPPFLLLHKTGGDETELLPLAEQVDANWPVIGVRGRVVEDGKYRFFRRLAPGVFDEDDIVRNAGALAFFIEELGKMHSLRPPIALGLSNGANIAAALMYLHPHIVSAAILLRPTSPFKALPDVKLDRIKVLCVAGRNDQTVPLSDTEELLIDLERKGAEVTREIIEAGHRLADDDSFVIRKWLRGRSRDTCQSSSA